MSEYELFDVKPNVELLRAFREEYLREFSGDLIYKITSKSTKWYKYDIGVYSSSKIGMGAVPFISKDQLSLLTPSGLSGMLKPSYSYYRGAVNEFVYSGASNLERAKALRYFVDNEKRITDYFYVIDKPLKTGTTYKTDAIKINEDIYNMIMIQFRNFMATTTPKDLSRYAEYFNISEEVYAKLSLSESFFDDLFRCNVMSEEEIEKLKNRLEIEKNAILSLKRK